MRLELSPGSIRGNECGSAITATSNIQSTQISSSFISEREIRSIRRGYGDGDILRVYLHPEQGSGPDLWPKMSQNSQNGNS